MRLLHCLPILGAVHVSVIAASTVRHPLALEARARGIHPAEGEEPKIVPDNPYSESGDDQPGGTGYRPSTSTTGDGGSDTGESGTAQNVQGTASHSTSPFEDDEESEEDEDLIEKILDAVKDVLEQIEDAIDNAVQNSTPTTTLISVTAFATSTTSMAPSSTSNATAPNGNGTYNAAYDLSLPSIDMAKELASQGSLSYWSDFLTSNEYGMYKNDPLCFYANIESMYSSASASATASTTTSGSASTITSAPSKRSVQARQEANETCSEFVQGISVCSYISGSPQWSSSISDEVEELYGTALPDHLYSVHFATPSTPAHVTATVVSSTSCPGLNGGAGAMTSYRELKVSQTSASSTVAASPTTTSSSDAGVMRSSSLFLCGPLLALPLFL
ncbi:hypothetical protein LTR36_003661 [Oleoguttula mirabilis]|uniref:Uncharacterized protein n=1 Tax=Oleoguttula mirabilis TaxID=1507867 RepID=A0AAV9JI72_9PEZI|nr:hypothetical protein LTR36_003661 [Oleoguttula mirabilis]